MALRKSRDEPELDETPALAATGMTADEYFAGPETMQPIINVGDANLSALRQPEP